MQPWSWPQIIMFVVLIIGFHVVFIKAVQTRIQEPSPIVLTVISMVSAALSIVVINLGSSLFVVSGS